MLYEDKTITRQKRKALNHKVLTPVMYQDKDSPFLQHTFFQLDKSTKASKGSGRLESTCVIFVANGRTK